MRFDWERLWDRAVCGAAALGGLLGGLLGGWDMTVKVLLGCMAADFISGTAVAWLGRSGKTEGGGPDSGIGLRGIARKGLALLIVCLAAMLDRLVGGVAFREMVCWFYIANEALSILENTALAGVPWPEGLKGMLEQVRRKGEGE